MQFIIRKRRTSSIAMPVNGMMVILSRWSLGWYTLGAIVIGLLLAKWSWILFAPTSLSVFPARQDVVSPASASLFGEAPVSGVTVTTGSVLPNVSLVGVFTGKQGFAVLKLDDKKQLGVAVGEEISKGAKLVEVFADYVVIEHNGVRQQVNLENKYAGGKGVQVEKSSSDAAANVDKAITEWSKAQKEMQKQRELAHEH